MGPVRTFEEWNAKDRTFDAVVAAQTWHWFDPVAGGGEGGEAPAPRWPPGRRWNVAQPPPEPSRSFAEASRRAMPPTTAAMIERSGIEASALEGYQHMFDNAAKGIRKSGAYDEPTQWRTAWMHEYARDEWLDQPPTGGIYTRLPKPRLD